MPLMHQMWLKDREGYVGPSMLAVENIGSSGNDSSNECIRVDKLQTMITQPLTPKFVIGSSTSDQPTPYPHPCIPLVLNFRCIFCPPPKHTHKYQQ